METSNYDFHMMNLCPMNESNILKDKNFTVTKTSKETKLQCNKSSFLKKLTSLYSVKCKVWIHYKVASLQRSCKIYKTSLVKCVHLLYSV